MYSVVLKEQSYSNDIFHTIMLYFKMVVESFIFPI